MTLSQRIGPNAILQLLPLLDGAIGAARRKHPATETFSAVRRAGRRAEETMREATGGVNTHKGGIFALGLLCFAAGRLGEVNPQWLCSEVSDICRGLVERELAARPSQATAGERQFHQFGLTGARGEAESGFATVRKALAGWNRRHLHALLLRLMAVNPDSNLVSRGGMNGLRYVQNYAHDLLENGWDESALVAMDNALITRNLSPGGSADLLSVGWVLSKVSV